MQPHDLDREVMATLRRLMTDHRTTDVGRAVIAMLDATRADPPPQAPPLGHGAGADPVPAVTAEPPRFPRFASAMRAAAATGAGLPPVLPVGLDTAAPPPRTGRIQRNRRIAGWSRGAALVACGMLVAAGMLRTERPVGLPAEPVAEFGTVVELPAPARAAIALVPSATPVWASAAIGSAAASSLSATDGVRRTVDKAVIARTLGATWPPALGPAVARSAGTAPRPPLVLAEGSGTGGAEAEAAATPAAAPAEPSGGAAAVARPAEIETFAPSAGTAAPTTPAATPAPGDDRSAAGRVLLATPPVEPAIPAWRTLYDRALLLEKAGETDAAIALYRGAAALNPHHAATFYNWAYLLQQRGDLAAAISKYRVALAADPGHAYAHYNLGWLLDREGYTAAAARHYRAAIRANPDHPHALYNLGWLLQKEGHYMAAIGLYQRALEVNPDHRWAKANLAELLAARNGHQPAAATH